MKRYAIVLFGIMCVVAMPAHADTANAREVARMYNCPPKKIEVYKQSLGLESETVYRVSCVLPKVVSDAPPGPDTILVGCRDNLCHLMRPVESEKK